MNDLKSIYSKINADAPRGFLSFQSQRMLNNLKAPLTKNNRWHFRYLSYGYSPNDVQQENHNKLLLIKLHKDLGFNDISD
jgi:hypothetical protein